MNLADQPILLLPSSLTARLTHPDRPSGSLIVRLDAAEQVATAIGAAFDDGATYRDDRTEFLRAHYSRSHEEGRSSRWHHATAELHIAATAALRRSLQLRTDWFRQQVRGTWRAPPPGQAWPFLTYVSDPPEGCPGWLAWWVSGESTELGLLDTYDEQAQPLERLRDVWPLDDLAPTHVMVLGVGSIGSAACETLAAYGVGRLTLVDPDRLLSHNLARHRATVEQLGRLKTNAVMATLHRRYPRLDLDVCPLNVIDDADRIRPVLRDVDAVLVCTDGVASRLAANQLTRWARRPGVFACVLAGGHVGEVLHTDAATGCLLCHRLRLLDAGLLDPEADIDLDYGTGSAHRPMASPAGDLEVVAVLAAKTVVASLLHRAGWRDQQLPGGHAVIGLRPNPLLPEPFATPGPGTVTWRAHADVHPECPVCAG